MLSSLKPKALQRLWGFSRAEWTVSAASFHQFLFVDPITAAGHTKARIPGLEHSGVEMVAYLAPRPILVVGPRLHTDMLQDASRPQRLQHSLVAWALCALCPQTAQPGAGGCTI